MPDNIPSSSVAPRFGEQATRKRKRGGRRRGRRGTPIAHEIHLTARARHVAWAEGDHALAVQGLTTDLDDLYAALRDERKGRTSPYRGSTTNWKAWEARVKQVSYIHNDRSLAANQAPGKASDDGARPTDY